MRRFAQAQRAFQGSPSRRRGAIFRLPALSRAAEGIDSMRMSSAVPAPLSEEARARGSLKLLVELWRSEEHTSELQSLMRISYSVFCLKKQKYMMITPVITILTTM